MSVKTSIESLSGSGTASRHALSVPLAIKAARSVRNANHHRTENFRDLRSFEGWVDIKFSRLFTENFRHECLLGRHLGTMVNIFGSSRPFFDQPSRIRVTSMMASKIARKTLTVLTHAISQPELAEKSARLPLTGTRVDVAIRLRYRFPLKNVFGTWRRPSCGN